MPGAKVAGWPMFDEANDQFVEARDHLMQSKMDPNGALSRIALGLAEMNIGIEDSLQELYERIQRLHQKVDRIEKKIGSI
jgi:hypothetical protein